MKSSFKTALIYGFLVWLIPFMVAFLIYFPTHESNRALFESIMAVTGTFAVILFSILYFKKIETNFINEGIKIGLIWFAVSLVIDFFMFLPKSSPMHLNFSDYMMDIGLSYLGIPIVTIGMAYLLKSKNTD